MPEAKRKVTSKHLATYPQLLRAVTKTLIQGNRELESLKVQIYWKTGSLIHQYLKNHPEETKHGQQIVEKLARDLKMEQSLFYRLVQFARSFPNFATWRNLTWAHYRELLTVNDSVKRKQLAETANSKKWPVRKLAVERKRTGGAKSTPLRSSKTPQLAEPARRAPGTFQVSWLHALGGKREKVIDLGFEVHYELTAAESRPFQVGEFVQWSAKKKKWQKAGTAGDLYYFGAKVERIVDGDTLLVHIAFGHRIKKRQYLRLQAINTPPLSTAGGRKAHQALEKLFKDHKTILFRSRARDAYDRYISDVWVGNIYLNQFLLDKNLAHKVG